MQTINPTIPTGQDSPHYFNRETSWLAFNQRVLQEACDERTPLLERLKFLSIFSSNLDEFFMKRVGGLKRQVAAGIVRRSPDGLTPEGQLRAIRAAVIPMLQCQSDCFSGEILPELHRHDIHLTAWHNLAQTEQLAAHRYFQTRVFPVLTPLAVDPGHPFPFISNLSTSLGVTLIHPESNEECFARVKIPEVLPQWIRLDQEAGTDRVLFISLQDLVRNNLDMLFPNLRIQSVMPFRITRNADLERDEDDAEDLLEFIEEEVRRRRFEKVVRLEHGPRPDHTMLALLMEELELKEQDIYELPAELDYTGLQAVAGINLPELRFPPWTPMHVQLLHEEQVDIFGAIRNSDLLVHHPYEDFSSSVEQFINAAASDSRVLAIKTVVYRTGHESPFIRTLLRAAEDGKQVACLVELKARFDEERNIHWAQTMEKAGIHVVYGLVGLKTHAKTTLVIRNEAEGIRCYAHIGTGNYHSLTARLYTDLSLLTCRTEITDDLLALFNRLTGRAINSDYHHLLVAPDNMRVRFLDLIKREAAQAEAGRPARIIAKMNSLEDELICEELYRASAAGVRIDLIVRGFCCLRPGVAGLSENIRVISVIGRFLEHSRIFFFVNGEDDPLQGLFLIGSADWMYRNLSARVEVVVPLEKPALREKCWEILQTLLRDNRQAWELAPDGTYRQRRPQPGEEERGSQQTLMQLTRQRLGAG